MISGIDSEFDRDEMPENLYKRNKVVYAWTDKSSISHFASATMTEYPTELPYVNEEKEFWFWGLLPMICRELKYGRGYVAIRVQRYDQDQPTAFGWTLRRRQAPSAPEYNVGNLQTIVNDALSDGIIDYNTTQFLVDDVESNFAISSSARAHYGPAKNEIYLNATQ
jgi:hypothetical protein